MKKDLLDLVFEGDVAEFRDYLDHKIGERHKTTNRFGNERLVNFYDRSGKCIGHAQEIQPAVGENWVEIYDSYYQVIAKVDATPVIGGKLKINYYDTNGKRIASRYVEKEKPDDGGGIDIGGDFWLLVFVGVLACCFAGTFLEKLDGYHYMIFDIQRIVQLVVTKLACPIVLILCLIYVPFPKEKGTGAVIFYLILVLTAAVVFVPMGIQLDRMMQPFGLGVQGWNNVKFYAMSILWTLVFYSVSFAMMKMTKNSRNKSLFRQQCYRVSTVFYILAFVFIMVSRMTAAYAWQYTPYGGEGQIFAFRFAWYLILTGFLTLPCIRDFKKEVNK